MLKIFILSIFLISCSFSYTTKVTKLEIYDNISLITKEAYLQSDDIFVKFKIPSKVALEQIHIDSHGCDILNYELKEILKTEDEISLKIKTLIKKKKEFKSKIDAIKEQNRLLNTIDLSKTKSNLTTTKQITTYYEDKIFQNLLSIESYKERIKKLDQEIKALKKEQQNSKFNSLKVEISCKDKDINKLYLTYPIYTIKKESFYKIFANTQTDEISIKNSLFLTQSSGEDFFNIDLFVYTYSKTSAIKPIEFYPIYLDINPIRGFAKSVQSDMEMIESIKPMRKVKTKSTYKDKKTKSYYHVENVNLKKGVKTPIELSNKTYKANFKVEIDGYASSTPFFKATFKPTNSYNLAKSQIYLDQAYLGVRYIKAMKKDQNATLYFGEDAKVEVTKTLKKEFTNEQFFSKDKITKTKVYIYEIKNLHNQKVDIDLIERVYISKHEDIKIEVIANPLFSKKESNGKVIWSFSLDPNETKVIEFGYEVDAPRSVFIP